MNDHYQSPYKPTPAQLADFDQRHAGMVKLLNVLVNAHREAVANSGEGRPLCISGLALYLMQETEEVERGGLEGLASFCAVAIDHIVGDVTP